MLNAQRIMCSCVLLASCKCVPIIIFFLIFHFLVLYLLVHFSCFLFSFFQFTFVYFSISFIYLFIHKFGFNGHQKYMRITELHHTNDSDSFYFIFFFIIFSNYISLFRFILMRLLCFYDFLHFTHLIRDDTLCANGWISQK